MYNKTCLPFMHDVDVEEDGRKIEMKMGEFFRCRIQF